MTQSQLYKIDKLIIYVNSRKSTMTHFEYIQSPDYFLLAPVSVQYIINVTSIYLMLFKNQNIILRLRKRLFLGPQEKILRVIEHGN